MIFLFGISLSITSMACEFCGCSSGNYFISPFPQFKKSFVGTRYTFRRFDTVLSDDPSQFSHDFYQSIELWGGVNLGKRWQVFGFLPYAINQQNSDDGLTQTQGLGDLTLLVNYKVLEVASAGQVMQRLWIGAGTKLPVGKYNLDPDNLVASASNQPGSGSVDYVSNLMYSLTVNSWGVNASVNYKYNQPANGFRFGNRLAVNAFLYRTFYKTGFTVNPNMGILYEFLQANRQDNVKITSTGGFTTMASAGLEVNVKGFTTGFNVQLPIVQDLSDGQTRTIVRGMVNVAYAF